MPWLGDDVNVEDMYTLFLWKHAVAIEDPR